MQHWEWLYKKAKAAITAHENKIERISAFIRCAKAELQKQERESPRPCFFDLAYFGHYGLTKAVINQLGKF